jgi:galactoside O-acetyltransferase
MTNRERKAAGLIYRYDDPEILGRQHEYQDVLFEYNRTRPSDRERRAALLRKMFAEIGENCFIETPLNSNWGCHNVHLGAGVYANSNLTLVDDAEIYIGDHTMIAPNVVIATAGHPILPLLRGHNYEYAVPVKIGKNVWIGSNVSIMPGVTIGDNSVVGAGSTVTRDIPANVVAFGVPCKVIREIGAKDEEFFFRDRRIDVDE